MSTPAPCSADPQIVRPPVAAAGARWLAAVAISAAGMGLTGCQVDVGGQTLPSAYYLQDDIQYFPAGPEFKLSKEAAAQKAYRKQMAEGDHRDGVRR